MSYLDKRLPTKETRGDSTMFISNIMSALTKTTRIIPLLGAVLLVGCGSDDDDSAAVMMPEPQPMEYSYDVTVVNLTYAQPLSPIGVMLHDESTLWQLGMSASTALEMLAEGGDNSGLLNMSNVMASQSGTSPLGPGGSETITITTTDAMATHLSVVSMLVNTNDAFSGLTGVALDDLALNTAKTWHLPVYDSGTEANSESVGTIPGPADSGVGFDEMRDDINVVTMHPGVVSKHDGLTNSVLTQAHRFDNPSIKLTITRTK